MVLVSFLTDIAVGNRERKDVILFHPILTRKIGSLPDWTGT